MVKSPVPLFRPADIVLAALLGLAALSVLRTNRAAGPGAIVRVAVDGRTVAAVLISADTVFTVDAALGETEIRVRDGSARITRTRCPLKICQHQGRISAAGRMLVCVPNRLTVAVEGGEEANGKGDALDGVTQ